MGADCRPLSGSLRALPSHTSKLRRTMRTRAENLQKYLSPSPRRVNFTLDCCPVYQQGREGEQERTWASLLPLRKTVKPLHLSSWANRNASATSDSVAVEGRLIVFETPLSLER